MTTTFAPDFAWGAATAAYQIEGAAYEDGKGLSVWDMFTRKENAVWRNQNGDIACDHYHRYQEDVGLLKAIGMNAYRFSVAWTRVIPTGTGAVNPQGLAFYDRLVDELLAAGITPYVTLFHWDYPYDLYCRGGWLNPDSPDWFAEYAAVLTDQLSDRVKHWMTLNEPQCFIGLGHKDGIHAPGDRLGWKQVLQAGHHALLAHGKAVQVIRARAKTPPQIGFAPVGTIRVPASHEAADIEAARQSMFSITSRTIWNNTWFSDPIFLKQYSADGLAVYGADAPHVGANDMETIGQPLDFYGCNIYSAAVIKAGEDGQPVEVAHPQGNPLTLFYWDIVPDCLYWGPRFLYERYQQPILITESGLSCMDWVALDGKVHDPQRIDYLQRHLRALRQAYIDGVDVRGYLHWSSHDNFEWGEGYKQRFGLIHVDYPSQTRTLKDSAYWYRDTIKANGANL